ncbi:MAG: azurin [Bacteroidetes bacterium]|nr:azurin [Bacteroidota bacterium]
MKKYFVPIWAVIFLLVSCGQGTGDQKTHNENPKAAQADTSETTVPGADKLAFSDTLKLSANENMKFDNELFRVKSGKKLRLVFYNTSKKIGAAMSHNVVILNKGTDIADFAEVARTAKNEQYVPSSVSTLVVAHTNMVAAGDKAEIEFTIPQAGVYNFICSYPGHWGTMQGKIVAE